MPNYLKSASTKLLFEKATSALRMATRSHRTKRPLQAQANMSLWEASFDELERRWLEAFPVPRLVVRMHPLFMGTPMGVSLEGQAASHGAFEIFLALAVRCSHE